jgi:hypothetical protein
MGLFSKNLAKLGIGSGDARTVLARIAANGGNVPKDLLD